MTVRVRIAPSPTGDPHVGTGYIALFNYAFAKQHGGKFLLRIEDTDQSRSTSESERDILDAIRWLGLEWDEGPDVGGENGPYRQSERLHLYKEHAETLIASGKAYRCTCTSERLAEVRKRQMALKQPTGYDGRCRERDPAEVQAEIDAGAPFVVRLRVPKEGRTIVRDRLRGDIAFEHTEVDDQVLMKSDGFPTYHLANVVDDHLMGITHVIRGEEWISSTPKHVLMYEAFGWDAPEFIHLPLLRNADKSKVSKRKNPVSLNYFKEAGYTPEAMVNFLGMMAFTFENEQEKFTLDEFVKEFNADRISLGGPVFDMQKLLWLNGRYVREDLDEDGFVDYLKKQLFNDDYLRKIAVLVKERVEKSEDFVGYADFFFKGSLDIDPAVMMIKKRTKKESTKLWEALTERLERQIPFTEETIEAAMKGFIKENELKPRDVFMPTRIAVTGTKKSPPLYETMVVLGRERVRTRLRAAVKALKKYEPPAQ